MNKAQAEKEATLKEIKSKHRKIVASHTKEAKAKKATFLKEQKSLRGLRSEATLERSQQRFDTQSASMSSNQAMRAVLEIQMYQQLCTLASMHSLACALICRTAPSVLLRLHAYSFTG